MKAFIVHEQWDNCDGWEYDRYYDNLSDSPPIKGASCQTYIVTEKLEPDSQGFPHMEARINEKGEPYIHTQWAYKPHFFYKDFEKELRKFKEDGFDHTEEKYEDEKGVPHWVYTRKVTKWQWWIDITSIEQLEEMLKDNDTIELQIADESPLPDCKYILRI